MSRWSALTFLVVLNCTLSTMVGEELHWSTIRGPHFDGHSQETGLAKSWPANGPPVLWTRELGQGYSSFVAWDRSVATQYQTLGGQYVVCLDADTGAIRWEHRYGWPYDSAGVYPGPRATPVYNEGCIYFSSPTGLIGCCDAIDGHLHWSIELETTFRMKVPGFGYACSPIVVDDLVVVPVGAEDANIVALDKHTGGIRWKGVAPKKQSNTAWNRPSSNASYCSVLPIEFRNRKLVVCFLENSLICHDLSTGEHIWKYMLSSGYDEHSAWPIYKEPFLWISGPFQRGSELIELTDDASVPIRSKRQSKLLSNDIFSSVAWDEAIFGFDLQEAQAKTHRTSRGVFRCVDFLTGEELWSVGVGRLRRSAAQGFANPSDVTTVEPNRSDSKTIEHCTVLVADGKLILMTDLGELILAKANRQCYEELSRTPLLTAEICWTQPALARQRLFVRNQSRAVCVYLGQPENLEPAFQAVATSASEIPQGRYFDIAGVILGVEPEYLFDPPTMDWLKKWYYATVLMLVFAAVLAIVISRLTHRTQSMDRVVQARRLLFWLIAFLLGAVGTTILSRWTEDFFFTWPLCLYVVWDVAISKSSKRSVERTREQRIQSLATMVLLAITFLVYFYLCRRLSLVFEWVFLTGFLASVPFQLMTKSIVSNRWYMVTTRCVLALAGFTAYYWFSTAVLLLRS